MCTRKQAKDFKTLALAIIFLVKNIKTQQPNKKIDKWDLYHTKKLCIEMMVYNNYNMSKYNCRLWV